VLLLMILSTCAQDPITLPSRLRNRYHMGIAIFTLIFEDGTLACNHSSALTRQCRWLTLTSWSLSRLHAPQDRITGDGALIAGRLPAQERAQRGADGLKRPPWLPATAPLLPPASSQQLQALVDLITDSR
jgi:hypothetical protein